MNRKLWFLVIVVLLSRIPLLFIGYGIEEDSWGIARAVITTAETGVYETSRLPGHPVHELFYLLAPFAGPVFYNGLTALFSCIAVLFFALALRELGFKDHILPAYTLAFIPVFYVSSTYTIDYVWTLAFTMISFYYLLRKHLVLSGIFLGLAVGCRLTAGAMLLPFFVLLYFQKQNIAVYVKLLIPLFAVAFFSYSILYLAYGFSFFRFYDQFSYPAITKVIFKGTIGVFGALGLMGILYAKYSVLKNKLQLAGRENLTVPIPAGLLLACNIIFVMYIISYLRLPQKSGYLIPILPFVLISAACYLDLKKFRIVCILLMLSSLFFSINLTDEKRGSGHSGLAVRFTISGQEVFIDPLTGPVFADQTKRLQKKMYVSKVIRESLNRNDAYVVIAGWWYNQVKVTLHSLGMNRQEGHFEFYLTRSAIDFYISQGCKVYYLAEQDKYNDEYSKMNYTGTVATLFLTEE